MVAVLRSFHGTVVNGMVELCLSIIADLVSGHAANRAQMGEVGGCAGEHEGGLLPGSIFRFIVVIVKSIFSF